MTSFLLSYLVRSTLLGSLGLATLWFLRKRSASVQHATAVGTILAMIALPGLAYLFPTQTLQVSRVPGALACLSVTSLRDTGTLLPTPTLAAAPTRLDWAAAVPLLWFVGTLLLSLRLCTGILLIRGRIAKGRALPIERSVEVVEDRDGGMPMVVWMGRPVVLMPQGWSAWPGDRLEYVLAHEEAHVRRGDWFSQILVHIATIAIWPNPLVHTLARCARLFAEQAADDLVLSSGADPSGYASALLEIAREAATSSAYAIPMATTNHVARRIEMILSTNRQRGIVTLRTLVISGLLLAVASVPVATWALVQNHPTGIPSQGHRHFRFGGTTPLMILNQEDVQADLALTDDQVQHIDDLLANMRREFHALPKDSSAKRSKAQTERDRITDTYLTQLEAVLTPEQRTRLQQIFVQWRQNDAILEADVQAALNMTPAQKARINDIAARYQRANTELYQKLRAGLIAPEDVQPIQEKNNTAYEDDLGQVLTPAQASALKALGGAPFTGHIQGTIWTRGF